MKTKMFVVTGLAIAAALTSCNRTAKDDDDETKAADAPANQRRVEVTEEARAKSGIQLAAVGPAVVKQTFKLNGKITANEDRMAHVSPRFPGIVKAVAKHLGDHVKQGEALAVVESNDSLQRYDVKSEIDGTIIKKDVTLGEFVDTSTTIFVVADLSNVWVDFSVYRGDAERLREGEKVLIKSAADAKPIETTIAYISPFGAENTQTTLARAVVPNADGALRPGLFVEGQVVFAEVPVEIAVKAAAIQTIDEKPVVFVYDGKSFVARDLEIGQRDDENVEIKSGLKPGEKYATENSFVLKSALGNQENEEH